MVIKTKPKNVEEYIQNAPDETRKKLSELRFLISKAAPKATEDLKWGNPAFLYDRILVVCAGFKKHISLYPTPRVINAFAKELKEYQTGENSVQFPLDKPLPEKLITQMVEMRVKNLLEDDEKWM